MPEEKTVSDYTDRKTSIKILLIFGPTAVGKTALLEAPFFQNTEIINADSMQVYRGMNIGTAKPDEDFLKRVKHHLIDICNPDEQFNAGSFVSAADKLSVEISERGRWPVICGGTGFYFKNFICGLPQAPPSDEETRRRLQNELEHEGSAALFSRLENCDPESASRINPNDTYRILRALEVFESSGKPLSFFKLPQKPREEYNTLVIGLKRDRKILYDRINERVDIMFNEGLVEEVKGLMKAGFRASDPGMKGIGYREFFEIGINTTEEILKAKELIKRNSRRYAKRQITWFRQLDNINWFEPDDVEGIISCAQSFFRKNDC